MAKVDQKSGRRRGAGDRRSARPASQGQRRLGQRAAVHQPPGDRAADRRRPGVLRGGQPGEAVRGGGHPPLTKITSERPVPVAGRSAVYGTTVALWAWCIPSGSCCIRSATRPRRSRRSSSGPAATAPPCSGSPTTSPGSTATRSRSTPRPWPASPTAGQPRRRRHDAAHHAAGRRHEDAPCSGSTSASWASSPRSTSRTCRGRCPRSTTGIHAGGAPVAVRTTLPDGRRSPRSTTSPSSACPATARPRSAWASSASRSSATPPTR